MSGIRIFRPKQHRSVTPATVLPLGLMLRLFRFHADYTVVLDDQSVGKIGTEQVRVFEVEPGEHRLSMRFVGLRRSKELRISLREGEERQFLCGTSGMGWPTLQEASPEDVAEMQKTLLGEAPESGDPMTPS